MEVTLAQMLAAREARAAARDALIRKSSQCVISFSLNIPGPVKRNASIERAYRMGLSRLTARFSPNEVLKNISDTGCEALLAVNGDPTDIKRRTVAIEDADPLGRLFDLDVWTANGLQLSRSAIGAPSRSCLLCGRPAHECARSRTHTVAELFARVEQIIDDAVNSEWADTVAQAAQQALLFEVSASPKPGLVDRFDSGAHTDMDFFTFMQSIAALSPYWQTCARIGTQMRDASPEALFSALREPGLRAEEAMFAATDGVNTHKGAVYIMGIACAAAGKLGEGADADAILALCGEMARPSSEAYFARLTAENARSIGDFLYLAHGIRGVRGEAADGFPAVRQTALPVLDGALARGLSINDAAVTVLMHLIAVVPDTTLIHRSSFAETAALQAELSAALKGGKDAVALAAELNPFFIQRHWSAGGCADLLSLTLFLREIQTRSAKCQNS